VTQVTVIPEAQPVNELVKVTQPKRLTAAAKTTQAPRVTAQVRGIKLSSGIEWVERQYVETGKVPSIAHIATERNVSVATAKRIRAAVTGKTGSQN
jgi:hypothetical protein